MATTVQANYLLLLQDAAEQGETMARNKHAILTKEEYHRLALNTMLPVDVLNDKYRAYRNAYIATTRNNHATDKALKEMGL